MSEEQGLGWLSTVSESMLEGELLMGRSGSGSGSGSASASASLPSDGGPESTRFPDRALLSPELPVPERGRGPPLDPEEHESVRGRPPELLSEAWL